MENNDVLMNKPCGVSGSVERWRWRQAIISVISVNKCGVCFSRSSVSRWKKCLCECHNFC